MLTALSDQEVETLLGIQRRLTGTAEAEGHGLRSPEDRRCPDGGLAGGNVRQGGIPNDCEHKSRSDRPHVGAGMLDPRRPLTEEHRRVLASLSPAEVDTLLGIQRKLAEAAEAEAHALGSPEDEIVLAVV